MLGQACLTRTCRSQKPQASGCDLLYEEAKSTAASGALRSYLNACQTHPLAPIIQGVAEESACFGTAGLTSGQRSSLGAQKTTQRHHKAVVLVSGNLSMRGMFAIPGAQQPRGFVGGALGLRATDRAGWFELIDGQGYVKLSLVEQSALTKAFAAPVAQQKLTGTDGPNAWKRVSVGMVTVRVAPRATARAVRLVGGELLLGGHSGDGWYAIRNEANAFVHLPE